MPICYIAPIYQFTERKDPPRTAGLSSLKTKFERKFFTDVTFYVSRDRDVQTGKSKKPANLQAIFDRKGRQYYFLLDISVYISSISS
ncbi:hypothetical protein VIBNIAM115_790130 [Vibrio nigripulchritudo AM115]|nr:hypothetical protein VIBNIAM115_790130 [Vibrio nigripulchritudo AM115]